MNYIKLKAELDNNVPLYGGLNDQQVANELNTLDKIQNRLSMARQEIMESIDSTELNALTGDDLVRIFGVLSDSINPFGIAQQIFVSAFGGGSATITALAAARIETVTRASQIGLINVQQNDVTIARAQ